MKPHAAMRQDWHSLCLILLLLSAGLYEYMVAVQQSPQEGWLQNDNTVLISALAAITVATSSVLLWRCQRSILLQDTAHAPAPSTLRTAFTSLRLSSFSSPMNEDMHMEAVPERAPHDVAQQGGEESAKGKASRSKERRRRGKGPFKELSKGGKRYKELLRQLNQPSMVSNEESTMATSEQGCPPQDTNESPSVQTSDSSRPDGFPPNQFSTMHNPPIPSTAKSPGETPNPLLAKTSDATANAIEGREDNCLSPQPTRVILPDTSPAFREHNTSSLDASPQASLDHLPASTSSCGSSSLTEASCSSSNMPSRKSQKRSHTRTTSCSWDWDGQSSFYHDPPPRFAGARATNTQRGSNSPIYSPVTFSLPDTPLSISGISISSSIQPSTPCDDAASPASPSRVGPRHPPIPLLPLTPPPISVSAQTQIASLRGALEAARLREEKSRVEAERRAKDYDVLSWRWTEERTRWHRREAEVRSVEALFFFLLIKYLVACSNTTSYSCTADVCSLSALCIYDRTHISSFRIISSILRGPFNDASSFFQSRSRHHPRAASQTSPRRWGRNRRPG